MTPNEPPPTLLPGRPADAWARVMAVFGYASIPVWVLFGISRFLISSDDRRFSWAFPLALTCMSVVLVGLLVFSTPYRRRIKAETAAGYTTTWHSQPTLPQLDGRTGELIRKAGDPYVKRSAWPARESGPIMETDTSGGLGAPHDGRPGWWLGARSLVFSFVVAVVGFAVLFLRFGGAPDDVLPRMFAAAGVVAVLFIAIVASAALVVRGRLRRLATATPDFSFVFGKSKEYAAGFLALTGAPLPETGYVARGASANATGLTIWQGNPLKEVAHLNWDAVTSIQPDSVPGSNNSRDLLALITFTDEAGSLATLPLAYPRVNNFPVPSRAEVSWIIDRLNALRAGTPAARLI